MALTKGAANTLKRDRVRAFGVNLGWTVTPSEHRVQTERHRFSLDWAETIGAKQPFGRLLVPEDVADLVAYLISGRPHDDRRDHRSRPVRGGRGRRQPWRGIVLYDMEEPVLDIGDLSDMRQPPSRLS